MVDEGLSHGLQPPTQAVGEFPEKLCWGTREQRGHIMPRSLEKLVISPSL